MTPDIKLKDFYLQFIKDAKEDYKKYDSLLNMCLEIKEEVYNYLDNNKNIIKFKYHIDLNDYDIEWNNKLYNPEEQLYKKVFNIYKSLEEDEDKSLILYLIKYCKMLYKTYKYDKLCSLAQKRTALKQGQYRDIITNYYTAVHKCVLEGNGYKFAKGLGTYCINYSKMDAKLTKPILDYSATNARKKEFIEKGYKLYDQKEADWYASRHIPYDGKDYRVYKNDDHFYDITFVDSKLFKASKSMDYKHTEYINVCYRGMSYIDMADKLINKIDDIYSLQVDIKYKLNILLYKYPTKYLNFIRDVEQDKYKYRTHNSQN